MIDYYLIDNNGKRVEQVSINDEVALIIESENMVGKNITINLSNKSHDFEYQGSRLANDRINNFQIKSDQEKIKLKIIAKQDAPEA